MANTIQQKVRKIFMRETKKKKTWHHNNKISNLNYMKQNKGAKYKCTFEQGILKQIKRTAVNMI